MTMFYAALDVSLRSVAICIIDEAGKVRLERSVPSDVPDIVRCFNEFGQPIHQVGLEAGTLTQHLTYGLTDAGFDVVCMEARQVNAALSAMRNKTDKNDARALSSNGTENTHKLAYRSSIPAVRGSRSGLSSPRAMISGRVKA
ncbi:IS110 family transposase [Brucella grignonensis]|uniref:IS110 family transposase n=1 Tax=Brucella grignonensis TaxID=94627 RepID=UPI0035BBFA9C